MFKITVDFNNMTADGEKVLVARDRDTDRIAQLVSGMRVLLHEPGDFEVEAVVEPVEVFDGVVWWYGTPDWSTRHDLWKPVEE